MARFNGRCGHPVRRRSGGAPKEKLTATMRIARDQAEAGKYLT